MLKYYGYLKEQLGESHDDTIDSLYFALIMHLNFGNQLLVDEICIFITKAVIGKLAKKCASNNDLLRSFHAKHKDFSNSSGEFNE